MSKSANLCTLVTFVIFSILGCSNTNSDQRAGFDSIQSPIVLSDNQFDSEIIAQGLAEPTAMAIAPDGRIFVALQAGQIRVIQNGSLLSSPFASVSVTPNHGGCCYERGLVGIALDENFSSNGHVYIFYTTNDGGVHNRVSRFTANGNVAQAGSEVVLIDFPPLSNAQNHNGGALLLHGGYLWVTHGDNADSFLAQNLSNPFGSVFRFRPDGSIPTDNPFYGSQTGLSRAIWAYGFRNPFTMAVEQSTGKIFVNDVGGSAPEEINALVEGGNFGHGGGSCEGASTCGANPIPAVYSYPRDAGRCAISGGSFYDPGATSPGADLFPSSYYGKYFFSDYCGNEIWSMNSTGSAVATFAEESNQDLLAPVDLDLGRDGSLYFLQRGGSGRVGRIWYPSDDCASDSECSDGNACNGTESCVAGSCQPGSPVVCNDGDPCTVDVCMPAQGCTFPPNDSCNGATRFEAEDATFTNAALFEDAGATGGVCVDGSDGATISWEFYAEGGSHKLRFAIRAPSGVRTMGVFANNSKIGTVTTTTLRPQWAVHEVTAALNQGLNVVELRDTEGAEEPDVDYLEVLSACTSAADCDDGNACNGTESCVAGSCQSGSPVVCDDGDPCTGDVCIPAQGCTFPPNDSCSGGTRFEAEDATFTNATLFEDAGATGGVCVDGSNGATIRWEFYAEQGLHKLGFAIRAPSGVRTMGVFANNSKIGTVTTTTLRPQWAVHEIAAALNQGLNVVELRDTEGAEEPDVDYLEVTAGASDGFVGNAGQVVMEAEQFAANLAGEAHQWSPMTVSGASGVAMAATPDTGANNDTNYSTASPRLDYPVYFNEAGSYYVWVRGGEGGGPGAGGSVHVGFNGDVIGSSDRIFGFSAGLGWSNSTIDGTRALIQVAQPGYAVINAWMRQDGFIFDKLLLTTDPAYQPTGTGPFSSTFTTVATCGDFECNGSEGCDSCPWDCGHCPTTLQGLTQRPANPSCIAGPSTASPATSLSQSPCVVSVGNPPVFASGVIPYAINQSFWSDGAAKSRYVAIPDGTSIQIDDTGDWTLPPGGVTIKNFQSDGQYIETRFFVRYSNGEYGAWTYRWNSSQTEAQLVSATGETRVLPNGQIWSYPSGAECFQCHTAAAGFSLGLETSQLNRDQQYPSTGVTANQLTTLDGIGLVSNLTWRAPFPDVGDDQVSLALRSAAYLHVNCSNCHRPGSEGRGPADLRFGQFLSEANVCAVESTQEGYPGLDLLAPSKPDDSVLWLRMSQRTANYMPPIGSTVVDSAGAALLHRWITGVYACP